MKKQIEEGELKQKTDVYGQVIEGLNAWWKILESSI